MIQRHLIVLVKYAWTFLCIDVTQITKSLLSFKIMRPSSENFLVEETVIICVEEYVRVPNLPELDPSEQAKENRDWRNKEIRSRQKTVSEVFHQEIWKLEHCGKK